MARYAPDHKKEARGEIVRRAAERFRKDGIAAVGMRALMADAGLTHGAFYAHFPSRADLVSEAVDHALGSTIAYLQDAIDRAEPGRALEAVVNSYLRPIHRKHMDLGCAASALAPELAREEPAMRARYAARNRAIIDLIASTLPAGGAGDQRLMRAYAIFAGMMGSLQLMRIATDRQEVELIMEAGRRAAIGIGHEPW